MLENLTVLEVTDAITGPVAGLMLSDLGARVIKVEPPEWRRSLETRLCKRDDPVFLAINRGKMSMVLDFIKPEGREIFEALVEKADVVLSNYPPAVVYKLGLDYDTLGGINPRIICCNISGYGLKGKDIERPAYDLAIQAVSGLMSVTGEEGGAPLPAGQSPIDEKGGIMAAFGILAAYIKLQKEGRGQQVDISMFDNALLTLTHAAMKYRLKGILPEPQGSATSADKRADFRAYQTKDGYFVLASGRDNEKWGRVCRALGREELAADPRFDSYEKRVMPENRHTLEERFKPIFRTRTTEEWMGIFSDAAIPCAPVNTLDKALRKAEELERGMVVEFPIPSGEVVKGVGCPVKVGTRENLNSPPRFGQHTTEVLSGMLSYSERKIRELAGADIVILEE